MSLAASLSVGLTGEYSRTKGLGRAVFALQDHPVIGRLGITLTDGALAGQADLVYLSAVDGRALVASAFEDLDLRGLLPDAIGDTIALATVKILLVHADPTNLNDMTIGGAAANTWVGPFGAATHKQTLRPGGIYLQATSGTGWTVTAGTGDLLRVQAGASAALYHIAVIGTSA